MEKDDEIKGTGNSYDYGARMLDPRVGRFLSVDPIAKDYPWNSPFAFAENRVIDGIELEGLEYASYKRLTNAEKAIIFRIDAQQIAGGGPGSGFGSQNLYKIYDIGSKLVRNKGLAESETERIFGEYGINNEADAFRHTLFNALNTQSFGEGLAKELGDAHEALDDPDRLEWNKYEIEMDLHNNIVGRQIGVDNPDAPISNLSILSMEALRNGELTTFEDSDDNQSKLIPTTGKLEFEMSVPPDVPEPVE